MDDHGSYVRVGSLTVDMQGQTIVIDNGRYLIWEIHGLILVILWCGFNAIGYMAARLFKHVPCLMWSHRVIGSFTCILTIVFVILAWLKAVEMDDAATVIHLIFGVITLALSAIELLTGIYETYFIYGVNLETGFQLKLKGIHKWIGIFLSLCIPIVTITGGWLLYQSYILVGILAAWSILVWVVTEVCVASCNVNKRQRLLEVDKELHLQIKKYTTAQAREMRKSSRYVLVDNYLCDVDSYVNQHPGARNSLEDSIHQDVSRYIIGSVPYNSKFPAFDHTYLTCLYAAKTLSFGELEDDHRIVISGDKSTYINCGTRLHDKRVTAGVTSEFSFTIDDGKVQFARYLPGFSWMGKHFSFTSKKMNKTRLYSLCLSGNEFVHDMHRKMINNIDLLERSQTPERTSIPQDKLYDNLLQVYIKRYPTPGAFSDYLHVGNVPNDDLEVKGPLGLGLDLEDSVDGTYVAFSAGTGIYCFLDFVAVALRQVCQKIAEEKFNYSENTLIENEKLPIGKNFKLIMFASYPDEVSAYWHDLFVKTAELDKKYGIGIFEYHHRISSINKKRWDDSFYKNALSDLRHLRKVLLCGPANYLDDVKARLLKNKLAPPETITLV